MVYTITRTIQGTATMTLTRAGEFVLAPAESEVAVFDNYDAALSATVELQVKHDLKTIKSPCTYSLCRTGELPKAA